MGDILVGTASWADKSLLDSKLFYPKEANTAEARLRYYATHFSLVEVDSSSDVFGPARLEERETRFVELTIDRPEIGRVELARRGAPSLDVHSLDPRGTDRAELRIVDRREQPCALLRNLGQRARRGALRHR